MPDPGPSLTTAVHEPSPGLMVAAHERDPALTTAAGRALESRDG